jgi:hypothetical protein
MLPGVSLKILQAGVTELPVKTLKKLRLEHPDFWKSSHDLLERFNNLGICASRAGFNGVLGTSERNAELGITFQCSQNPCMPTATTCRTR